MPTRPLRERLSDKIKESDKAKPRFGNPYPALLAANRAPEASRSAVVPGQPRKADVWQQLHSEFTALRKEEVTLDPGNKRDRWLRAYVMYNDESGDYGRWSLSRGLNEEFLARFQKFATRAGLALGSHNGNLPIVSWLACVWQDLLEHKSELVSAEGKRKDGILLQACTGSAIYCARLEKKALETTAEHGHGNKVSGASVLPPGQPNYTSELKYEIRRLLLKNRRQTALDVCRRLDADGRVELPESWKEKPGDRLFERAYRVQRTKHPIESMISKVRTDLLR